MPGHQRLTFLFFLRALFSTLYLHYIFNNFFYFKKIAYNFIFRIFDMFKKMYLLTTRIVQANLNFIKKV